MAGAAASARCDLGRQRGQFRPVLGARDHSGAVPVRPRRPAGDRTHPAAGIHRRGVARLSAGGLSRPALRLPRPRPLRARCRPPLQSQQAADRSLRQGAERPVALERRPLRLPLRQRPRGPVVRPARQCPGHAQMRGGRRRLYLGRRSAARRALGRDHHLRDPRARHDPAPSARTRAAARHLRRPGPSGDHRSSREAGDHRDRAVAGPCLRPGPQSARKRPHQLLGLQYFRLLRAGAHAIWRAGRSANSRPWSSASTMPGSR